jgi:hypothetical protein
MHTTQNKDLNKDVNANIFSSGNIMVQSNTMGGIPPGGIVSPGTE